MLTRSIELAFPIVKPSVSRGAVRDGLPMLTLGFIDIGKSLQRPHEHGTQCEQAVSWFIAFASHHSGLEERESTKR